MHPRLPLRPARGTTFLTFVYRRAEGAMIDACNRERDRLSVSVDIDDCELGAGSVENDVLEEEGAPPQGGRDRGGRLG